MEALLQALQNPGEMSSQQWLLVVIMLFVLVGSGYFVWRLYRIIETERRNSYVPNIGRKRLNQEAGQQDEQQPASGRSE